ncbi:hypothetical protein [Mangrovihabitans endophyticus]|uniref:Uncharacterized protein n=1 Tax=Mangrovihabitans endophyticus TaxID=1751298 RepID=A0A8J3BXQ3_9ACTN|nr:hypothetical protein [Mangrovihabitans endophyticus]GGK81932.1 hypothetical protein GCM10012284_14980 [Mangrovihabitans endophyticus]
MNTEHRTQEYIRRLSLISDHEVGLQADPDARQALFEQITATAAPRAKRPRMTRGLVAVFAGVAVAAAGGAAWAGLTGSGDGGPANGCHIADGSISVVKPITGDPVADCAAEWKRETGADAPPLVAYDNGHGGTDVVTAGTLPDKGWTRLEPGVSQDPTLIELDAALDDRIDGLRSDCLPLAVARTATERELSRLGLHDWSVTTERGAADGTDTCTYYSLDAVTRRVVLVPVEHGTTSVDPALASLARALREHLRDSCDPLETAADYAREAAARAGVEPAALVVSEITDAKAACTRAEMRVDGRAEVILRGRR